MVDCKKFRINDEYILHICSSCWKKFRIYKATEWTDATYYFEAHSDDGITWCFGPQGPRGEIREASVRAVAEHLARMNRGRRYTQLLCVGCAGSSEKASHFERVPFDTIEELIKSAQ